MGQFTQNVITFLADTWYWWLIYTATCFGGYVLYYHLVGHRVYREVDGKPQVKHGRLGKWADLEEHLREEHEMEVKQ